MRTLPITILVHEGPIARAYLAAMFNEKIRPERIILMIPEDHPGTGKPIGKWLPSRFRRTLAEKSQNLSIFHWPRVLRSANKYLTQKMIRGISEAFDFPTALFEHLTGQRELEDFSDNIERVMVADLSDPRLVDVLNETVPRTILFTGGGIVPQSILDIKKLRVLHVHPGYLPFVRGSDGLLWSYLVRGYPGASCFYMAPGIDTGEIIVAKNYDPVTFPVSNSNRPDDQTLYRLIFSFFDPVLRAKTLVNALSLNEDPASLPSVTQNIHQGITYHFMSPEVRHASLLRIFPECT